MNTQKQARQLMTQHRQEEEHRQDSLLQRTSQAVAEPSVGDTAEQARELLTEHRQQEEHRQESMLERASEAVGKSGNA